MAKTGAQSDTGAGAPGVSGRRGLLWPTILTAVALAILLGLGTWQLQRLSWKEHLIAQVRTRASGPPIPLAEALARTRAGEDLEYMPVEARGRLLTDRSLHYYAPDARLGPGFHIYTPLLLGDGSFLIVNEGYVPDREMASAKRQPAGADQVVVGLIRKPGAQELFSPANDAARNLWYWRDLAGMARAAMGADATKAVPFFLDARAAPEGAPRAPGTPRGGVTLLVLPNRHLEYALTWYGLAAALIAVYSVFARGRLSARR